MFSLEAKPRSSEDRQSRSRSRANCDATDRHAAACKRLQGEAGNRPARLELGEAEIEVWHCYLDALGDDHAGLLSSLDAQEIERYRGFSSEDAARQFLAGRALTRAALSCYANVPPRLWSFAANEHGRPAIDEPRAHRGLCFNLSHTSNAAVLAIGRLPEVGIDVESTDRPVDIEWIGRSVFTQSERGWVAAGARGSEGDRFFDLWTLKEAYIKARGRGFSLRPDSFELANADGRFRLRCSHDCDPNPERWQFRLFSPRPNLRVALAIGSRTVTRARTLTCCLGTKVVVPGPACEPT
jgi:4'-phosphopantetheinyl transferase